MNTRNFFSLLLVAILAIGLGVGCSKKSNPVAPQTTIVEPTDSSLDFSKAAPGSNLDYFAIVPGEENGVYVVSFYFNKNAIYDAENYPQIDGDFTDDWSWEVMEHTGYSQWYKRTVPLAKGRTYNCDFSSLNNGGRKTMLWNRKKEVAGKFAFYERSKEGELKYGLYGGDIRFNVTLSGKIKWVDGSDEGPTPGYGQNNSMSIGFEVIGVYDDNGGLSKTTVVGQYPFIFTNVGIDDAGNRYDNGKSYPLSSGLRIKVAKGLGFWLMASDENGQLLAVRITTYNTTGGNVDTEDLIYKRSIEKTATVAFFNILIDSSINQDTAYGPTNSYVFTFHVNRIQSDNSGWNRILSAWTTLPNGTEWINGNGYQLKAYPTIIDGSLKTWVGIRNVDIASGTVTDITGKTYPLSSFPNSFWFDSATYVLIEYNNNGAIVNGHQAITKDVYFSNERITSNWTFWTETSGNGGVTLNPGGKYKFTMTAPDTFRIYPALDDLLRFCYIETDGQQKIHVDKADKNPDNSTSVRLNIVLKSDGTVTYFGAYPVDGMLGGNP